MGHLLNVTREVKKRMLNKGWDERGKKGGGTIECDNREYLENTDKTRW